MTFEHNRTETPPVTIVRVAVTAENFRSNVVGSTNSGISHESSGLSPIIDDTTIANSKVDLIKVDGIAVCGFTGLSLKEARVVGIVVEFVETS